MLCLPFWYGGLLIRLTGRLDGCHSLFTICTELVISPCGYIMRKSLFIWSLGQYLLVRVTLLLTVYFVHR